MSQELAKIPKQIVDLVDANFPSIEVRGSKIYNILKKYFESEQIEDYDLDSFAIYWLASRVSTQMQFAATEIFALTRIVNFRHYWKLCQHLGMTLNQTDTSKGGPTIPSNDILSKTDNLEQK